MKQLRIWLIALLIFFISPVISIALNDVDDNQINLHFFYRESCPHCTKQQSFHKKMIDKYPNLVIHFYEVEIDKDKDYHIKIMNEVKQEFDLVTNNNYELGAIPYTVIGTREYLGFNDDVAKKLEDSILYYSQNNYRDVVTEIINGSFERETNPIVIDKEQSTTFTLPIIGEVDAKSFSLPIIAAVIGTVDGFNPCAMWVLLFIITLCINNKDRKRMWIIGLTFLVTSALVYLLIMAAWLQVTLSVSSIKWVQIAIGIAALIGAYVSLRSYIKSLKKDDGCEVVDVKRQRKMIAKIKDFTLKKSLFLALIGVIALAISVNLVELACSAGLPLMFTQILALNDLGIAQYWGYMLLYIFFFMLDDIIIFTIAMITFKVTGLSTKFSKYSHLIGGIIMLILGLLLIFKPEIIMLNF